MLFSDLGPENFSDSLHKINPSPHPHEQSKLIGDELSLVNHSVFAMVADLYKRGEWSGAEECLRMMRYSTMRAHPHHARATAHLAEVLLIQGKADDALRLGHAFYENIERHLLPDVDTPEALHHLAREWPVVQRSMAIATLVSERYEEASKILNQIARAKKSTRPVVPEIGALPQLFAHINLSQAYATAKSISEKFNKLSEGVADPSPRTLDRIGVGGPADLLEEVQELRQKLSVAPIEPARVKHLLPFLEAAAGYHWAMLSHNAEQFSKAADVAASFIQTNPSSEMRFAAELLRNAALHTRERLASGGSEISAADLPACMPLFVYESAARALPKELSYLYGPLLPHLHSLFQDLGWAGNYKEAQDVFRWLGTFLHEQEGTRSTPQYAAALLESSDLLRASGALDNAFDSAFNAAHILVNQEKRFQDYVGLAIVRLGVINQLRAVHVPVIFEALSQLEVKDGRYLFGECNPIFRESGFTEAWDILQHFSRHEYGGGGWTPSFQTVTPKRFEKIESQTIKDGKKTVEVSWKVLHGGVTYGHVRIDSLKDAEQFLLESCVREARTLLAQADWAFKRLPCESEWKDCVRENIKELTRSVVTKKAPPPPHCPDVTTGHEIEVSF